MGIFSENNEKGKLTLVFDIGSSSVGGTLFLMQKSEVPKILIAFREPITLQENFDINKFLSSTIKSLEIVASRIKKAGIGAPESIFCVLSSLWHVSQTRVIRYEKNTPFVFTPKLATSLIQKEVALFEEEYLVKYGDAKGTVRSIEIKNIKTMLNGYESPSPLDQNANDLEISIFISISGEQVLKRMEESIRKHFQFKEIKFSPFTLASFAVVRDMHIDQDNFILMDIGGELTDISMIKRNILRESISFPLGLNFIIRGVAHESRSSLSEAESFISLLKDGHAAESVVKKFGPIIDKLKMEWLHNFQDSLANLSNDISVPATIFLVVDKEMVGFFSETIKNEQFNQYTLTESKFKVIFLDVEVFNGMVLFKEGIIRDPFLIIDSIYVNRFLINSALPPRI